MECTDEDAVKGGMVICVGGLYNVMRCNNVMRVREIKEVRCEMW